MMRSLFSGVSGLRNHQVRMDVIGNNIANVNTIGYKKSRVNFQDMISQTTRSASRPQENGRGGTNPMQVGLGMSIASIDNIMTPGSSQSTGKESDLMLQGDGFFVVSDSGNTSGSKFYTRNGAFDFDVSGDLVNANGYYVQGWGYNETEGRFNTSLDPGKITLNMGELLPAKETTKTVFDKNLQVWNNDMINIASANFTFTISGAVTVTATMSLSATTVENVYAVNITNLPAGYTVSGQLTIKLKNDGSIESFGGTPMKIANSDDTFVSFINSTVTAGSTASITAGNITQLTFSSFLAQDSTPYSAGFTIPGSTSGVITLNTATFTATADSYSTKETIYDLLGRSYNATYTFTPTSATTWNYNVSIVGITAGNTVTALVTTNPLLSAGGTLSLTFNADGTYQAGNASVTFKNGPGAEETTFALDFSTLTQYNAESNMQATADGYEPGVLDGYSIDQSGIVTGEYSNGLNKQIAQIAIAMFDNAAGLKKTGDSLYEESNNSGDAQTGAAGTNGSGVVLSSQLEMSNVDLSEEFTNMIITQRGFQANTRIITTSDEMLQELVNLKR